MSKESLSPRGEPEAPGVNYIRHLNAIMERFSEDDRLNPSHISLYMALFQMWNISHFRNPISISRDDTMKLSKIGSRTTYLKCMNELTTFGYIEYQPSHNPFKGSKVSLFNFWPTGSTNSEQALGHSLSKKETSNGQALGSSINSSKQIKKETEKTAPPPSFEEIFEFFKSQEIPKPELEAQKFFNYYRALDWKVAGRHPISDWQPLASNWILKTNPHNQASSGLDGSGLDGPGSHHMDQNKDYSEPL